MLKTKKDPLHLKTKIHDRHVVSVFTYGTSIKDNADKIGKEQRATETNLRVPRSDRKWNEWVRSKIIIRNLNIKTSS